MATLRDIINMNNNKTVGQKKVNDNKINFTKEALNNLPVPTDNKRIFYRDAKTRGLSLYITAQGVITFYVQKKINLVKKNAVIGQYPYMPISIARSRAFEIISAWMNGEEVIKKTPKSAEEEKKPEEITLDQLFDLWLNRYAKNNKKTWQNDIYQYNAHFKGKFGSMGISCITKNDLIDHNNYLKKEHGLYAANRSFAMLKTMYKHAIEWDIITDLNNNPTIFVNKFKEKSRERFLQAEELPAFFKALSEEENTTMRDYIFMSLMTGARRGNVMQMEWCEINFTTKKWSIPETKNGESLTVPLNDDAIKLLQSRLKDKKSKYVFPSDKGKSGCIAEPKRCWERIRERAGIKDIRIHDLRRSLGSWQAMTGVTTAVIGKTLGHKSVAATKVYERMNLVPVKDGIDKATESMTKDSRISVDKIIG